jgi:transposase
MAPRAGRPEAPHSRQLYERYQAGEECRALAAAYGLRLANTRQLIRDYARRHGLPRRPPDGRHGPHMGRPEAPHSRRLWEERQAGQTFRALAERHGLHPSHVARLVYDYAQRHSLARPPGQRGRPPGRSTRPRKWDEATLAQWRQRVATEGRGAMSRIAREQGLSLERVRQLLQVVVEERRP